METSLNLGKVIAPVTEVKSMFIEEPLNEQRRVADEIQKRPCARSGWRIEVIHCHFPKLQ